MRSFSHFFYHRLIHHWYTPTLQPMTLFLLPFSWLFRLGVVLRRLILRWNLIQPCRFPVPIIVVGNVTIGGTGKTPFVIWLAAFLRAQGYRPGIISRGVGGKQRKSYWVRREDKASIVGDEAVLLMRRTGCPLVIGADRVASVRQLLEKTDCNVIISDDGLQHYRLARDVEIVMVDHVRCFGNRRLLPAGPLREPIARLKQADFVIETGGTESEFAMTLQPDMLVSLSNQQRIRLTDFPYKKVHAVSAIGHPERFFLLLQQAGFHIIPHAFPDHYLYRPADINFSDTLPIIMTEKDAVKGEAFTHRDSWYVHIHAKLSQVFQQQLLLKLRGLGGKS
jgi:tetraacyldisaccharide 4'-kinase